MRFYDSAPVTGKISEAFRRFRRTNVLLFWLTMPVWFLFFVIVGYVAFALTRVGYWSEVLLGHMGVDAWE